jgi:hypothetical protein
VAEVNWSPELRKHPAIVELRQQALNTTAFDLG